MLDAFTLSSVTDRIRKGLVTGIHALEVYSPLNDYIYGGEHGYGDRDAKIKWLEFGETIHMYYPEENREMLNKYYPVADDNTIQFTFPRYLYSGNEKVDSTVTIKLIFIPDNEIYFMRRDSHYSDDCIVDIKTLEKDLNLIEIEYERERARRICEIYHKTIAFLGEGNKEKCYRLFKFCVAHEENYKWTEYSQGMFPAIVRVIYYLHGKGEIPMSIAKYAAEYDKPGIFAIDDLFFGYWDESDNSEEVDEEYRHPFEERKFIFNDECPDSDSLCWQKMAEILSVFYAMSKRDKDCLIYQIIHGDLERLEEFFNSDEEDNINNPLTEEFNHVESLTIPQIVEMMKNKGEN